MRQIAILSALALAAALVTLVLWLWTGRSCDPAVEIAALHDDYRRLLIPGPMGRRPAPPDAARDGLAGRLGGSRFAASADTVRTAAEGYRALYPHRTSDPALRALDPVAVGDHEARRAALAQILRQSECDGLALAGDPGSGARTLTAPPPAESPLFHVPATLIVLLIVSAFSWAVLEARKGGAGRSFPRVALGRPLASQASPGSAEVRTRYVVDISRGGFKARLEPGRPLEESGWLRVGNGAVPFTVAWQNAHFAGSVFERPLSRREFAQLLGDPAPAKQNGAR